MVNVSMAIIEIIYLHTSSVLLTEDILLPVINNNWLVLFKEIITVFSEDHAKLINTLRGKTRSFKILHQVV